MNREELMTLLPHRDDMLLLDEAEVIDGKAHGKGQQLNGHKGPGGIGGRGAGDDDDAEGSTDAADRKQKQVGFFKKVLKQDT